MLINVPTTSRKFDNNYVWNQLHVTYVYIAPTALAGAPFCMLGHVRADETVPRLLDISFTDVRIHNNDSKHAANNAFRLVQRVQNLRLIDVTITNGSPRALVDASHEINPNFTRSVRMVDGLHIERMAMHQQANAVQVRKTPSWSTSCQECMGQLAFSGST